MRTYAAIYDNEVRRSSSSGGIFSAMASQFEVVYGVAMTDDCYGAEMVRSEGDISSLRGSKYIQARMGDIFKKVKADLEMGKIVLFSGTGCQVNGLRLFLGKEYKNLTTVDVICHGVPSHKLWKKYLKNQEIRHGKVKAVDFRCKDKGWVDFGIKENQKYVSKDQDIYMQMFLRDYSLRPSCYKCVAKKYKTADVTIADFWGVDIVSPEMYDGKGTSLIIVRNKKGELLFDKIKDDIKYKEVDYNNVLIHNPSESSSVKKPIERDDFYKDLNDKTFRQLSIKYVEGPLWKRICRKVKRALIKFWSGGTTRSVDGIRL